MTEAPEGAAEHASGSKVMVKGALILADQEYTIRCHEQEGWDRLVAALPTKMAEACRQGIVPYYWYPMELRMAVLDAFNKLFAAGDLLMFWELGCFEAGHNLSSYYRGFAQPVGADEAVQLGKLFWTILYSRSNVEVTLEGTSMVVSVHGFPKLGEHCCHTIRGYIHGALEFSGAVGGHLESNEPTCINRGDDLCRFHLTWE